MNLTNQPYPLPWAPHHLGTWPIGNLPYTGQVGYLATLLCCAALRCAVLC